MRSASSLFVLLALLAFTSAGLLRPASTDSTQGELGHPAAFASGSASNTALSSTSQTSTADTSSDTSASATSTSTTLHLASFTSPPTASTNSNTVATTTQPTSAASAAASATSSTTSTLSGSSPTTKTGSSSTANSGAIAAKVTAGIVCLLLVVLGCICFQRRRQAKRQLTSAPVSPYHVTQLHALASTKTPMHSSSFREDVTPLVATTEPGLTFLSNPARIEFTDRSTPFNDVTAQRIQELEARMDELTREHRPPPYSQAEDVTPGALVLSGV